MEGGNNIKSSFEPRRAILWELGLQIYQLAQRVCTSLVFTTRAVLADKSKRGRHRHVVNDLQWNTQAQPLISVLATTMRRELQRKMANPFLTRGLRRLYLRLHVKFSVFEP